MNNKTNTIKDYYINIMKLYNNCVDMLTAINQSLSTSSPQVVVRTTDSDGNQTELRIPSFLYLENRLDEIENSFSNFFDIPKSGDAWFENNSNMYKFHMVKSNSSPQVPRISSNEIVSSFTDNNYFKDLVSPKTYLKLGVDNLTNNIEKMFIKKYVFFSESLFNLIKNSGIKKNEEYIAMLYGYSKGVDYEVYDSTVELPLKKEVYNSRFEIMALSNVDAGNPWPEVDDDNKERLNYKLVLNTIEYNNQEDSAVRFLLKVGDYISLNDTNSLYYVKEVNSTTNEVIIEERIGHTSLQTISQNSSMFFTIYNNNYSEYQYVQVPLEENQYIAIFIGTIYNNVRSILSDGVLLDMRSIYMVDEYGNNIYDSNGNLVDYIGYYKKYCKNIGDILYGFSEISNPLLSDFNPSEIMSLQTDEAIKSLVDKTINNDIVKVIPINKHLIDDQTTQDIINLHNQKSELNNKLTSINANIDSLYNKLTNTDWTQELSNSQLSIRKKLDEYYVERTQIITQINNAVDAINTKSVFKYDQDLKYRIRGVLMTSLLEEYISAINSNATIISTDIQYKYRSINSTTTSLTSIGTNVFTEWNQYNVKSKERIVRINDSNTGIEISWVGDSSTDNVIKWNQIDIPITQNEEVVVRVRYKYNIGQPFIDIYTPWSNEMTFTFPEEYKDLIELSGIVDENADDSLTASFNKTLINDGYSEHINNKFVSGQQVFFHMPENIYSGFNTSENNLLSLKDKLVQISSDLDKYRDFIEDEMGVKKYKVWLEFDNKNIELFSSSVNKININDTSTNDRFVKKQMRIIIKNDGNNPVKIYSMFPGNTSVALIEDNSTTYAKDIANYERVPILVDDKMSPQTLGQWVYFRQNNPYTKEDIYLNDENQRIQDQANIGSSLQWDQSYNNYIRKNNSQILYPFKNHGTFNVNVSRNIWQGMLYNYNQKTYTNLTFSNLSSNTSTDYSSKTFSNFYQYTNVGNGTNNYLMRFEDIKYNDGTKLVYLDENSNITEFATNGKQFLKSTVINYNGAFLYPDIMHKNNILIETSEVSPTNFVKIEVGSEIAIPITFEYCLGNTTNNVSNPIKTIKKSLYFDLKDSLFNDPKNFMIEITVNNNYSPLNNYLDGISILAADED